MNFRNTIKAAMTAGVLSLVLGAPAHAVDVSGVKVDDSATVAGKELKLNGAGVRTRAVFKVYAMGLYLTDKKTSAADVLSLAGPKRVALHMMREVSSDDLGQSFVEGLNKNSDKAEKSKIVNQTVKFGEMFANTAAVKKGDVLTVDWVPGSGTIVSINGKQNGDVLPDVAFFNALLKIWLGDSPADSSLKPLLLGGK